MNGNRVSICISTYNRVALLKLAIESVLAQTYPDWELIICDDGSTDGTQDYMSQIEDSRIYYIHHFKNIGKSNNMRSGFEASNGEYFIKFDDDDRLTPEFLAQTVEILDKYHDIDFVSTDHWIIDINNVRNISKTNLISQQWGRTKLSEGVVERLLETVFIQQSFYIGATLFRRLSLQDVGYMRPNIQNCEDSDLFMRLALAGKKGYYLPKRLMEYRFHAQQQGIERAISFLEDMLMYLESYQFESNKLEAIRRKRLAETQLRLGLSLIQIGQTREGQKLIMAGKSASHIKAWTGLALTLLNLELRRKALSFLWRSWSLVVSR
jgi:glycosyltransferase involved in cell wall biosynthesis